MRTGTQWTGSLSPGQTQTWFTFNWPAAWHVTWYVVPSTVATGAPGLDWDVQVERASADLVTYWIKVSNLTNAQVTFEGRYAILN